VWAADTTISQLNPLGKVPSLVMEDGSVMIDSRVMVEYLDTLTPVCKLLPPNGRERADIKCWEALADGMLDAAVSVRLERTMRPPELQSEEWMARQMGKVALSLKVMSARLGERLTAPASITRWPMWRWVARWAGCRSASRKSLARRLPEPGQAA
jgi:glutathione S-transferase